MTPAEFDVFARDILRRAEAAYLSTVDGDGHPRVRAMVNLRNPDLYPAQCRWIETHLDPLTLVFSTLANSAKVDQIRANPKASVLYAIPGAFKGITFIGKMAISQDPIWREGLYHPSWRVYYPQGAQDPGHALLVMQPVLAECWQDTEKFTFALGDRP